MKAVLLMLALGSLTACSYEGNADEDAIDLKLRAHDECMRKISYDLENAALPHMYFR